VYHVFSLTVDEIARRTAILKHIWKRWTTANHLALDMIQLGCQQAFKTVVKINDQTAVMSP